MEIGVRKSCEGNVYSLILLAFLVRFLSVSQDQSFLGGVDKFLWGLEVCIM